MYSILIIEDDKAIRDELAVLLESFGYRAVVLNKFENVVEDIKGLSYNLILLDINLPNQNGFDICRKIRETNNVPIIFVTSRNSEQDELKSIITGGSDFITKPYNKYILLEKIKRKLKESNPTNYKEIVVRDVTLDLHLSLIRYKDYEVELTRNEFRIMYYLFLNAGNNISKEKFMEDLWNDKFYIDENILCVNINRVRKKLEDIGLHNFIKTVRGRGYRI
mgnify:FL=1